MVNPTISVPKGVGPGAAGPPRTRGVGRRHVGAVWGFSRVATGPSYAHTSPGGSCRPLPLGADAVVSASEGRGPATGRAGRSWQDPSPAPPLGSSLPGGGDAPGRGCGLEPVAAVQNGGDSGACLHCAANGCWRCRLRGCESLPRGSGPLCRDDATGGPREGRRAGAGRTTEGPPGRPPHGGRQVVGPLSKRQDFRSWLQTAQWKRRSRRVRTQKWEAETAGEGWGGESLV